MGRKNQHPVHLTDVYLTNLPQDEVARTLKAAEGLLKPSLFRVCAKAIGNCEIALRKVNGTYVPSLFFRTDMSSEGHDDALNHFTEIHTGNHYGMASEGLHLDWGFGQTMSPEIMMAYLGTKISGIASIFRRQSHFTLGIDPMIKGKSLGDIIETTHPYTPQVIANLGGYSQENGLVGSVTRKNAAAILQVSETHLAQAIPKLRLASFTAIAPTPGTLAQGLEFAIPRLRKGGRINVALTPIQVAGQCGIFDDRQSDLNSLLRYLNAQDGQHMQIPTNSLNPLQRGALEEYEDPNIREFLRKFGPFDTKYSSSGGVYDRQNPVIDLYTFAV